MATTRAKRSAGKGGAAGFERAASRPETRQRKSIDPVVIAERVERFEFQRWHRRYARDGRRFTKEPGQRLSGSLQTNFLQNAFAWLFRNQGGRVIPAEELGTHRQLVAAFWSHQAWWQSGSGGDDDDDL